MIILLSCRLTCLQQVIQKHFPKLRLQDYVCSRGFFVSYRFCKEISMAKRINTEKTESKVTHPPAVRPTLTYTY